MKKNKLLVIIFSILAVTLPFVQCTSDEADEAPTKVEILKAKAKQLSEKYGITVTLDEESLGEAADTLTLEQMEEDIMQIAALKGFVFEGSTSKKAPSGRNRLKIRLNKTLEEEKKEEKESERVNGIRVTANVSNKVNVSKKNTNATFEDIFHGEAAITYYYLLKGVSRASMEVNMCGQLSHLDLTGEVSNIGANFYPTDDGEVTFSGSCPVTLTSKSYYKMTWTAVYNYTPKVGLRVYFN